MCQNFNSFTLTIWREFLKHNINDTKGFISRSFQNTYCVYRLQLYCLIYIGNVFKDVK